MLATGCYVGKIPAAPGTFGSLIGVLGCLALSRIHPVLAVFATLVFIVAAVRIATEAEIILKKEDPGCIVIDEIAGMMIVLVGVPLDWSTVVGGFIIFRLLDIIKPFPIRILERRFSGGFGIVVDDVAAGIMANLALRLVIFLNGVA